MNKERQQPAPGPAARLRERPPSRQGPGRTQGAGQQGKGQRGHSKQVRNGGTRGTGLLFKEPTLWGRESAPGPETND